MSKDKIESKRVSGNARRIANQQKVEWSVEYFLDTYPDDVYGISIVRSYPNGNVEEPTYSGPLVWKKEKVLTLINFLCGQVIPPYQLEDFILEEEMEDRWSRESQRVRAMITRVC